LYSLISYGCHCRLLKRAMEIVDEDSCTKHMGKLKGVSTCLVCYISYGEILHVAPVTECTLHNTNMGQVKLLISTLPIADNYVRPLFCVDR